MYMQNKAFLTMRGTLSSPDTFNSLFRASVRFLAFHLSHIRGCARSDKDDNTLEMSF